MDFSTMVTSVLGPFLPAPVLNFARSHLDSFATQADSTLSGYAPRFLLDQMPLLMSLVALYFGFLSVMRAARVAWRSFIFFAKYGGLALFGTLLYSLYQGDTTALRSTFSTASSLASSAASLGGLSSLGTLAAWYLGADNTEAVKNLGAWAYKYFSPESDTATAGSSKRTNKKKKSNSNVWDSFLPKSEGKSGSPSANTRSKKGKGGKVDSKGLFEEVFGETPKRAGGGADGGSNEDAVKGFMDKVVEAAGGETASKLKKMAEMGWEAFNGDGEKKDGQGRTRGR